MTRSRIGFINIITIDEKLSDVFFIVGKFHGFFSVLTGFEGDIGVDLVIWSGDDLDGLDFSELAEGLGELLFGNSLYKLLAESNIITLVIGFFIASPLNS